MKMRKIISLALYFLIISVFPAMAMPSVLQPLGTFGALQMHGEECHGTRVDLWSREQDVFGVFQTCDGLVDTKVNIIFARALASFKSANDVDGLTYQQGTDISSSGEEVIGRYILYLHLDDPSKQIKIVTNNTTSNTTSTSILKHNSSAQHGFESPQEFMAYYRRKLGRFKSIGLPQ